MSYLCPLCHNALTSIGTRWKCAKNHQFDCAKEGYVNLLPVQHKRSKEPGDNKEMIKARRQFLETGIYAPLRDAIIGQLKSILPDVSAQLLDIGCGEGYYTAEMATQLAQSHRISVFGLDVSKIAVKYGAKRYPHVNFCVASSQRLPFNSASMDAVVRIYAPCNTDELARVIKPNGILLTVTPGSRHLYQLKALVYETAMLHPRKDNILPGFMLINEIKLQDTVTLSGKQGDDLLQMTPFAWRASASVREKLNTMVEFACETDFLIRIYSRNENDTCE